MRKTFTAVVLLLAGALLAGCGFQPRGQSGSSALPDDWYSMYLVTGNPNSELSREVRAQFAANGVQWADDREEANFVVKLGSERFSQRNLLINAEARAAEFELTMRARFSVNDAGGSTVMDDTDASVVRTMENDPRNVTGKAEEIRILKGEMRTDLSRQIMRRIGFYAASTR